MDNILKEIGGTHVGPSDKHHSHLDNAVREAEAAQHPQYTWGQTRAVALRAAAHLVAAIAEIDAEHGTKTGAELIAAERKRQIEAEGWTPEHDDAHTRGKLALAAAAYALPSSHTLMRLEVWPFDLSWFKPRGAQDDTVENRIRDLVKAGALAAAEIDRLKRLPEGL